jgi:hypothetical protein
MKTAHYIFHQDIMNQKSTEKDNMMIVKTVKKNKKSKRNKQTNKKNERTVCNKIEQETKL